MAHDLVTELLQYSSLACFMPIWQLCANMLIPNCLRSNLSYSPLAALELYVKNRYFLDSDIITLFDGTQIAVNNQWGTRFPKFLAAINGIYTVVSNNDYKAK